jgi:hypothetical protein
MTRIFSGCAALVLAVTLSAGAASAQTPQNGPYYGTPSWDQTLPAATRFILLANFNNDAVLDRETGLVWQRQPDTLELSWEGAKAFCRQAATGNRRGWHMPTQEEAYTLLDPTQFNPGLPPGHPFLGVNGDNFWTTTPSELNPPLIYVLSPISGTGLGAVNPSAIPARVWCVRGGSGTAITTN